MSVFKNVIVYRIEPAWSQTLTEAEEGLGKQRFEPCGPSQEKSAGWVEPRGEANGPLVESIETGAVQATEEVVAPVERKHRRGRSSLSMPYFSFAQSLRPRG